MLFKEEVCPFPSNCYSLIAYVCCLIMLADVIGQVLMSGHGTGMGSLPGI